MLKMLYEDELQRALQEDGSSSSSFISPKSLLSGVIMSNLSSGKYAKFISDRSGQEFPYSEMVKEWNGSLVHVSEFERKQPQLEPKPHYSRSTRIIKCKTCKNRTCCCTEY